MKIKITTTYTGVDSSWLKWWLDNSSSVYKIPAGDTSPFPHEISSKDPTSSVVGTTRIELLEEDGP